MHIAYYVRVSTQQQAQTQTIAQQLERLQAHSQAQGWPWGEEYIFRDEGYSGATLRRPGLEALREQVAHAAVERVVLTAPDRLARSYVHQALLVEEFAAVGCQVDFLDRPMSTDPHDQLLLQVRSAVAEYERTLITERLRRGRQHRYRAGTLLPWTTPPYGYRSVPERPRDPRGVYIEEAEAAVVAEIFALYLEPSGSVASVAKTLIQRNLPSPTGKARWTRGTVRRILTNPVYQGIVYAGRGRARPIGPARSPLGPVGRRERGVRRPDPDDWIEVGRVPAIVAPEQFARVQAKLAVNGQRASRHNTVHQYLLRALVSCGWCRMACTGQTRRGYAYYTSQGKAHPVISGRDEKCGARCIPMRQLDEVVWADLCALLTEPQRITQALERAQAGAWLPQELQARRATLAKAGQQLQRHLDRLTDAYRATRSSWTCRLRHAGSNKGRGCVRVSVLMSRLLASARPCLTNSGRTIMFTHDPYAPMSRAEMADRHQWAAQQRLRRSAREQDAPDSAQPLSTPSVAGLRSRLLRWITTRAVPKVQG